MIKYKNVSKYWDKIDVNKRVDVLINKRQCWLFQKIVPKDMQKVSKFIFALETISIASFWAFAYIFARNLLIMVTFMKYPDRYDIYELPDGMFVVELNPDSPPGNYE